MKPSRLAILLVSLLATPAAIGAACSFPQIDFQPEGASNVTGAAASGSSSATEASSTTAGSGGAPGSSSSSSGPPPCDGGPCDCDGDGEQSWECDGGDCADYDNRAHTLADFVLTDLPVQGPKKAGTQDFDFNCNGSVEGQIPPVPNCQVLTKDGCKGSGYLGPVPACGGSANLAHCNLNFLVVCETLNDNIAKTQGCR
jgi:hypothetical protein